MTASGTGRWKASRPGNIRLVAGESPGRALTYQWEQIVGPQLAGTVMNGAEPRTVEIYQQQEDGSFVTYNAPNQGHHPWALEESTDTVDIPIHGLENYGTPAGEY